jgi:hypothetical protein
MRKSTRILLLASILALLALVLALAGSTPTLARDSAGAPAAPAEPASPTDDGGTAEVGVEWITDWPGTADDRANWYYSANDLYNKLRNNAGWVGRFNWGNTAAWEKDWKHATYGGINDSVSDSVDLAMMATHGSTAWDNYYGKVLTSVYFSTNNHDWHLSPGEARRAFGNNDLEWLAWDSCSVLRDDSMYYWHETFDGLHLMLGFANTMYVVYRGDGGAWADELVKSGWWIFEQPAKRVTQAWFVATDDEQPSGVRARVLAEELNSYNDYIWGQGTGGGTDYPNDGDYWYWDHVAGTPDPLPLAGAAPTFLPAVQIVARDVNDDYVKMIGQAFGLSGQVLTSPDGLFKYMAGGPGDAHQLRVDVKSGGFFFTNLDDLWTDPERPRQLPPSEREAAAIALNFLEANDYLPGAFNFNPQIAPTVVLEGPAAGVGEAGILAPTAVISATNYAVHYAQTVFDGLGGEFSVVGPGARQNLYIGEGGQVEGFKGGWRDFQVTDTMIPILTEEEAWDAFLADPTIAVAQLPHADTYDRTGKPAPTLGYYEIALSQHQSQLIPVWIFVADLYVETPVTSASGTWAPAQESLVVEDAFVYVPAASDPDTLPEATILSPTAGLHIKDGAKVNLSGSASGGTPPYTYLWSSSVDGDLGSGAMVNNVVLHADPRGSDLYPNTIILTVIDDNGLMASASVDVAVDASTFLPLMRRE